MIDSHCHFDFDVFSVRRDALWREAKTAGLRHLLIPGVSKQQWPRIIELCRHQQDYYFALGCHPVFLDQYHPEDLETLETLLSNKSERCLAVGEIGLDNVIDVPFKLQLNVFEEQLEQAKQHDLPVIIHHRKSHNEIIRLLKKSANPRAGVIHAFSGSYQEAKTYVDMGFYLGVGGTITYPRANKTRQALRQIPLEYLLLETDAPDMPLMGYQGQPNSPSKLPLICDALSELTSIDVEQLRQQTTHNFKQLFLL